MPFHYPNVFLLGEDRSVNRHEVGSQLLTRKSSNAMMTKPVWDRTQETGQNRKNPPQTKHKPQNRIKSAETYFLFRKTQYI